MPDRWKIVPGRKQPKALGKDVTEDGSAGKSVANQKLYKIALTISEQFLPVNPSVQLQIYPGCSAQFSIQTPPLRQISSSRQGSGKSQALPQSPIWQLHLQRKKIRHFSLPFHRKKFSEFT